MLIDKLQKRYRYWNKKNKRRQKIKELLMVQVADIHSLKQVWPVNNISEIRQFNENAIESYTIFGVPINLKEIHWRKDYVSGFEYPKYRFDKIKISKWFNKDIDVKFPWEVSRFYFAIPLAQNYCIAGDEKFYVRLKSLISDWIDNSPFLYGINWHCTMEVAIRAVNWVVAASLLYERMRNDTEFYRSFVRSLVQHAHYIYTFPEIKSNGTGNNHLIADYAGLLFLALTLREHPESDNWLKTSVNGLVTCMETQVYDDGTSFEGSIPYHRLVLEMFGYSAVLCRAHAISLPVSYYEKLFKMFEFTAAYIDHNGNAPQIGDNDSGRTLIFHTSNEHDHSYLLDLGEHLFDYRFLSQCNKRNDDNVCWLPKVEKITICEQK